MLTTGCHKIASEIYHSDPCPEPSLSRGAIVDVLDAPIKAWFNHPRLTKQPQDKKENPKFDQGKAAHDLLLEGGHNIITIAGFDDWKKKAAQEAREAAYIIGQVPLLEKQFDVVSAMVESAKRQIKECSELEINDFVSEGDAELTYIWQEKNGVWCRVKPDWISKNRAKIVDYKTSGLSVNPATFSSHIIKMNYHIQESFYRRGVTAVDGKEPIFVFMAQENTPPYLCSFFAIEPLAESIAFEKVNMGIKLWGECLKSGKWPGYSNRVCWASASTWQLDDWENQKKNMEDAA